MQNARFLGYLGDVLLDGGEDNQDLDGGSGTSRPTLHTFISDYTEAQVQVFHVRHSDFI